MQAYYKIYNAAYWNYDKKASILAYKLVAPTRFSNRLLIINITTILDASNTVPLTLNITSKEQLATYQQHVDRVKQAFESKENKWWFDKLLDYLGKNKNEAKKTWDQIIDDVKQRPARTYDAIVYYTYPDRPDTIQTPKIYVQVLNHYDGIQNFKTYLANMIRDYALSKTLGIRIHWVYDITSAQVLAYTNLKYTNLRYILDVQYYPRDLWNATKYQLSLDPTFMLLFLADMKLNQTRYSITLTPETLPLLQAKVAPLGTFPLVFDAFEMTQNPPIKTDRDILGLLDVFSSLGFSVPSTGAVTSLTAVKISVLFKRTGYNPLQGAPVSGLPHRLTILEQFTRFVEKLFHKTAVPDNPLYRIQQVYVDGIPYIIETLAIPLTDFTMLIPQNPPCFVTLVAEMYPDRSRYNLTEKYGFYVFRPDAVAYDNYGTKLLSNNQLVAAGMMAFTERLIQLADVAMLSTSFTLGNPQDVLKEVESLWFMTRLLIGRGMFYPTLEEIQSVVASLPEGSTGRNIYDLIYDFYIARGKNPDGVFIPINEALKSAYKNTRRARAYELLEQYYRDAIWQRIELNVEDLIRFATRQYGAKYYFTQAREELIRLYESILADPAVSQVEKEHIMRKLDYIRKLDIDDIINRAVNYIRQAPGRKFDAYYVMMKGDRIILVPVEVKNTWTIAKYPDTLYAELVKDAYIEGELALKNPRVPKTVIWLIDTTYKGVPTGAVLDATQTEATIDLVSSYWNVATRVHQYTYELAGDMEYTALQQKLLARGMTRVYVTSEKVVQTTLRQRLWDFVKKTGKGLANKGTLVVILLSILFDFSVTAEGGVLSYHTLIQYNYGIPDLQLLLGSKARGQSVEGTVVTTAMSNDTVSIAAAPSGAVTKIPRYAEYLYVAPDNKKYAYAVLAEKLPKQYNGTIAVTIPFGITPDLHQLIYLTYIFVDTGVRAEDGRAVVMLYDIRFSHKNLTYPLDIFKLNLTTPTTGNQSTPGFKITYKNYDHVNPFNPAWTPPGNWTYVNHISDYTGANTTFWQFDLIDDPIVLLSSMNPSPINGTWIISSQHIGSQFHLSGYDYVVRTIIESYYVRRFAIALRILINGIENIPENFTYYAGCEIRIFNDGRGILIYPTFFKRNGAVWLDVGSFSLIYPSQHVIIPVTNRWTVIVVDFPPNDTPSVQVYDEHGQLLGEAPLLTFTSDWSFFDLRLSVPPYEDTNATWIIQIDWIAERIGTAPNWTRTQIFGFAGSLSNETRVLELYRNGVLVKTLNLTSYYHSTLIFIDNSSDTYEVDYMVLRDMQGHIIQTIDGIYLKKESDLSMNLYFSTRIPPPPQYVILGTNNRTKTPPGPRIKPAKGKS